MAREEFAGLLRQWLTHSQCRTRCGHPDAVPNNKQSETACGLAAGGLIVYRLGRGLTGAEVFGVAYVCARNDGENDEHLDQGRRFLILLTAFIGLRSYGYRRHIAATGPIVAHQR